jgi:hypothetical protein
MGAPSLDSLIAKIRASAAKDRNMAQALANASGTIVAASPQPPRYTPLSLTFVSYQQGDTIGKVAALVTLAPIFAHVAIGSWILARRELHAACLFAGSVLNTVLCVAIKSQVRQSRHPNPDPNPNPNSDPSPDPHPDPNPDPDPDPNLNLNRRCGSQGRPGRR